MQVSLLLRVSILSGLLLSGCQGYEPRPLSSEEHRVAWRQRSPESDSVVELARRLESEDAPADRYDPLDGLDCAEAEVVALVFNPELRTSRARAGIAAATAEHAGLWEDPVLAIDLLRVIDSVSNPWVIVPGLAFTIPISGRLEVEQARADAAWRATLARIAEEEWRVRLEVRRAWLDWSAACLEVEEIVRLLESMERLTTSTNRLAEAGELLRTEAALLMIERSQRRRQRIRLEGEARSAALRLRVLLGLTPDAPLTLLPSLDLGVAASDRFDVESNLDIRRLREEYEVAERSLEREIRAQYPDLTIGPLYETDQGQSRIGMLGVVPIPILNANRQAIAEATAARDLARVAYEAEVERTEGDIAIARNRMQTLEAEHRELAEVIGPMVDRQLQDATRLVELGEGGGLVLLDSLVRACDTRLDLIRIRRDIAAAAAETRYLLGPTTPENATTTDPGEETP